MSETRTATWAGFDHATTRLDQWQDAQMAVLVYSTDVMETLRPLREQVGITLRAAAREAGISAASLSLAERGELVLSSHVARRLLAVYAALPSTHEADQ